MKRTLSLVLLLYFHFSFATEIDKLTTTEDVVAFVRKVNPDFANDKFQIRPTEVIAKDLACGGVFKDWNIRNWEKTDLNNDGLTDLLIIPYWSGYHSYLIIDKGNEEFRLHQVFTGYSEECEFSKPFRIGTKNYLKIYQKSLEMISLSDEKVVIRIDTLTFNYDQLVELNDQSADYKIRSVELKQTGSDVGSPVFSIKIDNEGLTEYDRETFFVHKEKGISTFPKGIFKKDLGREIFIGLEEILRYIRVKELKNSYSVPWFHAPSGTLTVEFENGEVKKISDYGLQGTFGLKAVYSRLTEIANKTAAQ
jgi:hypothetical protein